MFKDLSAWFSASVEARNRQLWKDNGGTETNFDQAQMIFSSDNTCADTERVYNSKDYQNEHLAVFHSRYISDCVQAGDRGKVVLGKYYLPPPDIVALVKTQLSFCWDTSSTGNTVTSNQGNVSARVVPSTNSGSRPTANNQTTQSRQRSVDPRDHPQNQRVTRTQTAPQQDVRGSPASKTHNHTSATTSPGHRRSISNITNTKHGQSINSVVEDHMDIETLPEISPSARKRICGAASPVRTSPRKRGMRGSTSPSAGAVAVSATERQVSKKSSGERTRSGTESGGTTMVVVVDVHHPAEEHLEAALGPTDSRHGLGAQQIQESAGTSYHHISRLPKVTGAIEDFTPGQNGCEVYLRNIP